MKLSDIAQKLACRLEGAPTRKFAALLESSMPSLAKSPFWRIAATSLS